MIFLLRHMLAESTTGTYLEFANQLLALSFQRFTELVKQGFGSLLFRHIAMASYTTPTHSMFTGKISLQCSL